MRTVKTKSGATAVQILHSNRRGSREIEHIGSAHTNAEVAALKAAATDRLAAGQQQLDFGLISASGAGRLPITSSRMAVLLDTIASVYDELGFTSIPNSDSVFRDLVAARIIDRTVNRDLETKARTLVGWKAYATNIDSPTPEFVIGSYHQLWRIEKSFRMSKSDLAARPIFHHLEDSIRAHLAVVFAALAITRVIETRTGWSIKKFVTTARRCRTITIQAGEQAITAANPLPDDLRDAIIAIRGGH